MSEKKCYETIMIFSDKLTEEEYQKKVRYYKKWFTELPATRIKTDLLGKRKLSYDIRGCKYGYYSLFMYQAADGLISSCLEETLRADDDVIKFITVVNDSDYTPDDDDEEIVEEIEEVEEDEEEIATANQAGIKSEQKKKPVDILNLIYGLED